MSRNEKTPFRVGVSPDSGASLFFRVTKLYSQFIYIAIPYFSLKTKTALLL